MSAERLEGLKVAILVENGFEQVELVGPRKALDAAGAETRIVSPPGHRSGPTSATPARSGPIRR
jgi:protease I